MCNLWGNLFPALAPGSCELIAKPILKPSLNAVIVACSGDGRVTETWMESPASLAQLPLLFEPFVSGAHSQTRAVCLCPLAFLWGCL